MRGVIPVAYELFTAMFPVSELGHCTKEEGVE